MKKNMNNYIVTSDTDSLFFELKDLVLKDNPDININDREEVIPIALNITKKYQDKTIPFLQELSKSLFNTDNEYFELKQEVILERGYFAKKRRYAQFIVNKEGVPTEELDMKGLDLMKSNFPKMFREFGEDLLINILYGESKSKIDKKIKEFQIKVKTTDWRNLLKPTGLKNLQKYIASPPGPGEIFSTLGNKCPINTKAAIYYNDILRYKGLNNKYPLFNVGAKMYYAYLKRNEYGINCIAFNNYDDPPEIIELIEKYIDRDELFDTMIKNKIEGLYDDIGWSKPIWNQNFNKFFKF